MAQTNISKITPSPQTSRGTLSQNKSTPSPTRSPEESSRDQRQSYHYDLQSQRAQNVDNTAFEKIAADLYPPKKGKYIFAGTLALIGDILDWLVLTLIGELVTLIVDFIIDPLLTWMGFKMNKEVKKKGAASENLNGMIEGMHQKIEGYRNAIQSMRTTRSKLAGLKRTGRKMKIKVKFKKPKAIKKRGVLGKIFLGQLIDFIPFAELYPARTHSVWSAYKAEKAAYKEGLAIIQNCRVTKMAEIEEQNEYTESLLEEQAAYKELEQSQIAA